MSYDPSPARLTELLAVTRNYPDAARLVQRYDRIAIMDAIEVADRWLDESAPPAYRDNPLANMWRRISAGPVSEAAEAVDAANGWTGGNPRKGITHTQDDLLSELADTAVSALLSIQSQTKDTGRTWLIFLMALDKILSRVPGGQGELKPCSCPCHHDTLSLICGTCCLPEDRDGKLYRVWRCHIASHHDDNQECFSNSHLSLDQVREKAAGHADSCQCWLHAILRVSLREAGGLQ